jgi:hypothetical protein
MEPAYCRFIALGSDLYFAAIGKPIELRVEGTQVVFRSRVLPSFEADIETRRITSNLAFLFTLLLATPGLNIKNRAERIILGLALLFLTHVAFLVTKIEFSLVAVEHPLAGTPWLWKTIDNFLEVSGKAFFPMLIWIPLTLSYMMGSIDPRSTLEQPRRVGRNEPCPCGSGRKFKHCCGGN